MGGTITLFSKKVYSESAKTWTRYTYITYIWLRSLNKNFMYHTKQMSVKMKQHSHVGYLKSFIFFISTYFTAIFEL